MAARNDRSIKIKYGICAAWRRTEQMIFFLIIIIFL